MYSAGLAQGLGQCDGGSVLGRLPWRAAAACQLELLLPWLLFQGLSIM